VPTIAFLLADAESKTSSRHKKTLIIRAQIEP